jgi:stress response protein YsnF
MKLLLLGMGLMLAGLTQAFAAEDPKASPTPSNLSTATMSARQSTDDLTYAKKMQYRKEREEYNKLVGQYNEMVRKRAAEGKTAASAPPVKEADFYEEEKALKDKKSAVKKQAVQKKRVLVS